MIDWLIWHGVEYHRLNGESFFTQPRWKKLENIISIWFRRTYTLINPKIPASPTMFLRKEFSQLYAYNYNRLIRENKIKYSLNKYEDMKLNKLNVLDLAKKYGLNIPISDIICNKFDLRFFFEKVEEAITKPITNIFYFEDNLSNIFIPYTRKITKSGIEILPESFFPSFFQQYIEKEFEIRTVFLENEFYSMAIFSSLNVNTQEDFRNYDLSKMNRFIPFKLPNMVESSLKKLCKELDLNFCSIDLIFNGKDFYFLEINPVGQFGMTSLPCNYNIEKKIAALLSQKNNGYEISSDFGK